ncbi:ABC transporter substrate-binding protein|uniref:ABC transporter substrate-binding protein n=1 Tax=Dendrosporobacter quercicolus TaxID=146817 RepID=UPI000B86C3B2|nr:ABC transporter substrate-binding protein [Dendrosporobacter quercicolus]NSL48868.1 ABC transporter substrate-binding protein [Dendrosporobacter quercicolus DSM 1736]
MVKKLLRKKMIALGLGAVLAVGAIAGCGGETKEAGGAVYRVGVLQMVQHGALDAANNGFVDGLASRGYKNGENITIDQQNAQGDQSNLKTISQRFVNNKVDLIYAIATPAAQAVANETKTIPVVGSAITDYEAAKLVQSNAKPGGNVTGTTDYLPPKQQIDLALKLIPQAKTVGALYNSSEANSEIQVREMKEYAAEKGLTVIEAAVTNVNDIQQAVQSLVGKADFIYCPTDNTIASAIANIARIARAAKLPVLAGDETMVKTGGAAGVSINYYKLGFQSGEMAADILSGKAKPADMPIASQEEAKVIINKETAQEIGLTIPEELLKAAE